MINRLDKLKKTEAVNALNAPIVEFSHLFEEFSFPLMIKPTTSGIILPNWLKENRSIFDQHLKQRGALLFRDFHINTVEKFQDFIKLFDADPQEYNLRSSPRYKVAKDVFISTTYPADYPINMHSESSYAPFPPGKIVFCCIIPAEEMGATPIADNRLVLKYLSPEVRDNFLNKGVKYVRTLSRELGLPWEEVFQTSDKAVVEAECKKGDIEFKWAGEEKLILEWSKKAIYQHPETGEAVWFNHAFFFNKFTLDAYKEGIISDEELPFNTFYGDNSIISEADITNIRAAYEKATVTFPWEKGDVLFLDNMLISHGRSPYKGDRKIIVSIL